jgi:site-specific recombinase XerD
MSIYILIKKICDNAKYIWSYSSCTTKRYKDILYFFARQMNITSIEEVDEKKVKEFILYGRTERAWEIQTHISYYNTLKVFLRWCVKEGYLEKDPLVNVVCPKPDKKLPQRLSAKQANLLLDTVNNYPYKWNFLRVRNYAILATLIYTGLRKEELLNLKYSDVDVDQLTIFVRLGKGRKDRIIPMTYNLAEALGNYLIERRRLNRTCQEFFVSRVNNIGFDYCSLRRLITQMRKATNLKFTAHSLRHTFATLMVEGGCDIYSLSKMMGHSDIKTTTLYLSATTGHLRSQITKHPLSGNSGQISNYG